MQKPEVTVAEISGFKVIGYGKPDLSKVPQEKLDRFAAFCMDSLDRYFANKEEVMKKVNEK